MFKYSPDYEYLYTKNPDGSVDCTPTKDLTEEDKEYVIRQIALERGY